MKDRGKEVLIQVPVEDELDLDKLELTRRAGKRAHFSGEAPTEEYVVIEFPETLPNGRDARLKITGRKDEWGEASSKDTVVLRGEVR